MTQAKNKNTEQTLETVLQKIGPISFDPLTDPMKIAGPTDDIAENEVWVRERAIHFRQVYENYPNHEAALACLYQHSQLERTQPFLFATNSDELDATEFRVEGLYRKFDPSDKKYLEDFGPASIPILERHDARAKNILSRYPNFGIAEWAYEHLISRLGTKLLQVTSDNIKDIELIVEELTHAVEKYLAYKTIGHTSVEPHAGYFEFGSRQSVDFLIRAVDALEPKGRSAQSALLSKISDMFPCNEEIANYTFKFKSFEKPFELEFEDLVSGESINIRDYRGKVVIVDFWATWCKPCLAFVPYMKKLVANRRNDVKIIGVSSDDRGIGEQATSEQRRKMETNVVECATSHCMNWPIYLSYEFHDRWHIRSIPTLFVVDKHGILRSLNAHATLAKTVDTLLNEG